jgi:ribonucleoside-diphosphate reductase beta chain
MTFAGGTSPYPALFAQWEAGQWSVADIDLRTDREQWPSVEPVVRDAYRSLFCMIHLGEQAVVDKLLPLLAAPLPPEAKAVIAGQASDEARHLAFMDRFAAEVLGLGTTPARRLAEAARHTGDGFAVIFEEFLAAAAQALQASPDDGRAAVRFVTCYHLLVEGAFGLTAQPHILSGLEDRAILPGFRTGFALVHRDEHRHMAIGVALLRDAIARDAALAGVVHAAVDDLAASWARLTSPPDLRGFFDTLGTTQDEFATEAYAGLERRLAAVGA